MSNRRDLSDRQVPINTVGHPTCRQQAMTASRSRKQRSLTHQFLLFTGVEINPAEYVIRHFFGDVALGGEVGAVDLRVAAVGLRPCEFKWRRGSSCHSALWRRRRIEPRSG